MKFKPFKPMRTVWERTEFNEKGNDRQEGEKLGAYHQKVIEIVFDDDQITIRQDNEFFPNNVGSGWCSTFKPEEFIALKELINKIEVVK